MPQPSPEQEDFDVSMRQARSALDLMAQLKTPPSPQRFWVMYAYQAGNPPDLAQAINRLVARDKLTALALDELYDQYFSLQLEEAELREASRRVKQTVADVADCIDAASGSAERYGTVLAGFSEQEGLADHLSTVLRETRTMAEINRQLEERLQASSREIDLLRDHLEKLEREANMDSLTGIANRKSFDSALRDALMQARRDGSPLSVLMIDIDHFKNFNDTHGHQFGDQVLKLVARYMIECIKGQDTAARYGGEEFGVVLPRTRLADAARVADQIRRHVGAKKVVNRRTGDYLGQITLSVGVAEYRPDEGTAELVHRADEALYEAKHQGRNRVVSEAQMTTF